MSWSRIEVLFTKKDKQSTKYTDEKTNVDATLIGLE